MNKEKTEEQKARYRSLSKVAVAARSLSPEPGTPNPESEPKITNMYSRGSGGGIDDQYYIDELIGLDDFTYDDWIGGDKRKEKKKKPVHPEWIRARKARHWKILSDHLKMQKEKN